MGWVSGLDVLLCDTGDVSSVLDPNTYGVRRELRGRGKGPKYFRVWGPLLPPAISSISSSSLQYDLQYNLQYDLQYNLQYGLQQPSVQRPCNQCPI